VDVVYEETDNDLRQMGGLSAEEDVFAPVTRAVKTAGRGWRLICARRLLLHG
jgi:Mg/Co/Ni transporter MgtE